MLGVGHPSCDPSNPGPGCRAPNGIGRNAYDANVTAHDMRETYLAGWKAVTKAMGEDGRSLSEGIQGLMCASNAVNGVPSCANGKFQNDIVRGGAQQTAGCRISFVSVRPEPVLANHHVSDDRR